MRSFYFSVVIYLLVGCSLLNKSDSGNSGEELVFLAASGLSNQFLETAEPAGSGIAGPSGTSIKSTDGRFSIFIPKGAMDEEVQFSITKYNANTKVLPGSYIPTVDVYQVTPSYRFKIPITINMILDEASIQFYNLEKTKSIGFSISSTSPENDTNRFPSWNAHESSISGDKLVFTTKTFSIFGGGTPPPGNQSPTIYGAYYYFKTGCTYLPYRLRTEVVDPDGDPITVYLSTGPANGGTNSIQMVREGSTNWYNADIPYEAMSQSGIYMQIRAIDSNGLNTSVPSSNLFTYPTDSGNSTFITNYKRDADNDGLLCAWERDNGKSDSNPSDALGITDSDGDGIPNSSDHTPNGEANPTIDSLTITPSFVTLDVTEKVGLGVSASFGGSFRFVNASYSTTGNALNGSPVGSISNGIFTANEPGLAGVFANVGLFSASSTYKVTDSIGPNSIADLSAITLSSTQIRLQWTAPGDDGAFGKASSYQIYRSTSTISNNTNCTGSLVFHGLTPKNVGLPERLDINGLSPNTNYYFCIRAFDDSGNLSSWNGTVSTATHVVPDLIPPSNISGAVAAAISYDKIKLDWVSVGDDSMIGSASAYEIRRSVSPINNDMQCDSAVNVINNVAPAPSGNALTFTVTGLSDYTIHYFCIRAYDEANNRSSWNGLLTATTLKGNSAPYVSLSAPPLVDIGDNSELNAEASNDPDGSTCLANTANYTYSWVLANKPIASAKTSSDIIDASTLKASFSPDVAGDYVFQFSFIDDPGSCSGGSKITTQSITIKARVPIYGHGLTPLSLSGNVSTFATVGSPRAITTDGKALYIGDGNVIRSINLVTRNVEIIAGDGSFGQSPSDGIGLLARFQIIRGATLDSNFIYLTDGHYIRKIEISTKQVTTIAGSDLDINFIGYGGYADGIGSNARFNSPTGITKLGNYLYVVDTDNRRIRRISLINNEVTTLTGNGSGNVQDGIGTSARHGTSSIFQGFNHITNDGQYLYILDASTIRKIDPITAQVTTLAGVYNDDSDFGNIDGIGSNARLNTPGGITTDGTYIYFLSGSILRKLNLSNNQVLTIAGQSSIYGSLDGVGTNALINFGFGLTNDGKALYFNEFSNNGYIRKVE